MWIIGEGLLGNMLHVRNRDSVYCQKGQLGFFFSVWFGRGLALRYYPCTRLTFVSLLRMMRSEDGQRIFELCRPSVGL